MKILFAIFMYIITTLASCISFALYSFSVVIGAAAGAGLTVYLIQQYGAF